MKKENLKKWRLPALLLLLGGVSLAVGLGYLTRDPLAALKETVPVESGTEEAEALTRQALELIEKDDMDALFRMMSTRDGVAFKGKYIEGLFREKDFCPAEISGTPTRLKISSFDHVSLYVRSRKRDALYQFSLVKEGPAYAIASISRVAR